ncbi:hypothetical protein [Azohydromonas lata]|uniref:hypothetical protein n=1 Tax=Azohydromonas lata TaxID=45677 RepID=UPI0012F481CA|nr:hypothetical protein [Azohydromonas lata]
MNEDKLGAQGISLQARPLRDGRCVRAYPGFPIGTRADLPMAQCHATQACMRGADNAQVAQFQHGHVHTQPCSPAARNVTANLLLTKLSSPKTPRRRRQGVSAFVYSSKEP